jgi:hypothetical protein
MSDVRHIVGNSSSIGFTVEESRTRAKVGGKASGGVDSSQCFSITDLYSTFRLAEISQTECAL